MRCTIHKILLWTVSLLLLFLSSCVKNAENSAPLLIDVVEDISIEVNSSLTVTYEEIEGYDVDGDPLTITLQPGENYTISDVTITPAANFIGDLFVPVQLNDGEKLSNSDTLIVSVVNEVVLMPLYQGSWWEYRDSLYGEDSATISRLVLAESTTTIAIADSTVDAHILQWENLLDYGVEFLVGNEANGFYQYGARTEDTTILNPQIQHIYPHVLDSSWAFVQIQYNITDKQLYEAEPITFTCTDTVVYVTVPAGTFRCVEYTYSYFVETRGSLEKNQAFTLFSGPHYSGKRAVITEKLYFADGVGYVKNVAYNGDVLVDSKVLTSYHVEEPE